MICIFSKGVSVKLANYRIFQHFCFNSVFPVTLTRNCFPKASLHTSSYQFNEVQSENAFVGIPKRLSPVEARRKAYYNVDWLPFSWQRRPFHNPFEASGDLVKDLEYDPSWPKPDFELSDELKTASDDIKYAYSLATASKYEIKEAIKRRWLEKIQRHPHDFDSLEAIIAMKTLRIRSLFEHSKVFKKDKRGGRKILDIMIKRRNRCLKYLYRLDIDRFNWICKELKLEYKPEPLGGVREKYTKKWDLRRFTKEYCAKMVKDKKNAYHEELKKQQTEFLKEKEEALKWIEEEGKEIARITKELENLTV